MDSLAARRASVVFETLLLQSVLEPIAGSGSALGAYGVSWLAESIAQHDSAFGDAVAPLLERSNGRA